MIQRIVEFVSQYLRGAFYIPTIQLTDVIEVLILTFLIYRVIIWIQNTKAWMLLKGIAVLGVFILIAAVFRLNTILYLAKNSLAVMATAVVIVFHPELRRALEKLGEKRLFSTMFSFESSKGRKRFTEETRESILSASFWMGKEKTGALMVIEREIQLNEFEATGILLDSLVSSQLLLNIFEHNTPLHDGAVIIRGNRIVSATCYLPLSMNMNISKNLGTRHRAALGMSEISDALILVVSEETGAVSVAQGGVIHQGVTEEELRRYLKELQDKSQERIRTDKWKWSRLWKGGQMYEKETDE